ncbi:MAG: hypothetical protein ACREA9_26500 [Pyrinomonadaceae bacterium]
MKVFLKQYGEKRTGTNYLRTLLLKNFPDVVPLMHVLGDKHSAPVPLYEYWRQTHTLPDAAWEFVARSTFAAPAESTNPGDPGQLQHMRSLSEDLAKSFAEGLLGFVFSVKHPYAWATSYARYCGWMIQAGGQVQMRTEYTAGLQLACWEFNSRHRAWLDHCRRFPARSFVVRYEDLLTAPEKTIALLASKFGLEQPARPLALPLRTVGPPFWDNSPLLIYQQQFNPGFYHEKRFLQQLSGELWEIVNTTIDWELVKFFEYDREATK